MAGLLCIALGAALIAGSGKIAGHNKSLRSREAAKAVARAKENKRPVFLARMQSSFHVSSLEAGRADRPCLVLIGLAVIGFGLFILSQPNGW